MILFRFVALLLAISGACLASVYYVDRSGGSDSADGLNPSSAWQSLARVRSAALRGGDYVLLKRGETWQEQLAVSASGDGDAPLIFGAYGDGDNPILDGTPLNLRSGAGMIEISGRRNIVVANIVVRNSRRNGISLNSCSNVTIRGVSISAGRNNGILAFNCDSLIIESSEIFENSLDLAASYDGVRVDSNREISGVTIRDCVIHDNLGGPDWYSANGVFIGHTGNEFPLIRRVRLIGNTIYRNGNPNQNQAGRGVTGTFHGDVEVAANFIHQNASAGLYLGDEGASLDIVISRNLFYNNALRQFGGFTDLRAAANGNTMIVDDPEITAMGAEIGGLGAWEITRNTFWYTTNTNDTFRSFIKINNVEQEQQLKSDFNLFYSSGPRRWRRADDVILDFNQWQAAGFDANSTNPR